MGRIPDDIIMHYGVSARNGAPGRGSGRYPLGSGDNPYQHGSGAEWLAKYNEYKKQGLSEQEIAEKMGAVNRYGKPITTKLRAQYRMATNEVKELDIEKAKRLYSEGKTPTEIGREMGKNESTIRGWLKVEEPPYKVKQVALYLKDKVDKEGMIDVSSGVERYIGDGITKNTLKDALYYLEASGYEIYDGGLPQVTNPGQQTIVKVLGIPGTEYKDIYQYDKVKSVQDFDTKIDKDGAIRKRFEYPASMDSKRLQIRYAEEGGEEKDGIIEIRRGVKDLSLGDSHYAQVRILVDDDHYLKGMAVYSDDMPPGVDVIFNTNKKSDVDKMDVLKKISNDPNNPFGSLIKDYEKGGQSYYDDPKGNYINTETGKRQSLSLINKRSDEGDWEDWSDKLPAQFLAKQNLQLVNRQLYLTKTNKDAELKEIQSLTNPTIKRKMLLAFAEDCDANAEQLKAAPLPGQKWQVILPLTTIKDNEIYAPNYKNGEQVALIRYPHAGIFEIPILTVNNKQKEGDKVITKNAKDAVGINSKVAEVLSGADFDGDTVMVIPINKNYKISSRPPLEELKGFNPKTEYGYISKKTDEKGKTHYYDKDGKEFKAMTNTQTEMGIISNLIADMTVKSASDEELARAVKHSMVVIDAEKHGLDYKRSYKENNIEELKKIYQDKPEKEGKKKYGGASTLITRANAEVSVDKRQGQPHINEDGTLSYKTTSQLYFQDPKTGKEKKRTQASTQMRETSDAYTLSSGRLVEDAYADFANHMKPLANTARKDYISTKRLEKSPSAAEAYKEEVDNLLSQLNIAAKNAPKEREAQRRANVELKQAKELYFQETGKDMPKKEEKKVAQRALTEARNSVGAKREPIKISERQWEAIQAGAISDSKLMEIINYIDDEELKRLATPKGGFKLSNSDISRIRRMASQGYTNAEIAEAMKISPSTVSEHL